MRKPRQRNFPELAGKLFYSGYELRSMSDFRLEMVNKYLVGYCRDCGKRMTSRNTIPYPDPATDDPTPVVLCPQCYDKRLK